MYESFYSFRKAPFANIPDPEFLLETPQHQQALSVLRYALLSRTGFCVITGDIGAGKTTLVRHALQTLERPAHIGLVSNSKCESFEELLCWILLAFDLEFREKTKVEMYDDFVRFLIRKYEGGTPVTLVIDEAQNLGIELLEQLRMLSNVNTERGQILQTILIGQPELWTLLHDVRLIQFAQRISYQFFLSPLSSPQAVRDYVEHRTRIAGGPPGVFLEEVFPAIYRASRGVPRLINTLCDKALVYGFGESSPTIGIEIIERVLLDDPIWNSEASSLASRLPLEANYSCIQESETVSSTTDTKSPDSNASILESEEYSASSIHVEQPEIPPMPAPDTPVDQRRAISSLPYSDLPKAQTVTDRHEGPNSKKLVPEVTETPRPRDVQHVISGSMLQSSPDPTFDRHTLSARLSRSSLDIHEAKPATRQRVKIGVAHLETGVLAETVASKESRLESDDYQTRSTRPLPFRSRRSRLRESYG